MPMTSFIFHTFSVKKENLWDFPICLKTCGTNLIDFEQYQPKKKILIQDFGVSFYVLYFPEDTKMFSSYFYSHNIPELTVNVSCSLTSSTTAQFTPRGHAWH